MTSIMCMPAVVFVAYMLIHIGTDLFTGYYNMSAMKFLFMIVYALLLNWLCFINAYLLAWILVFIPFTLLSLIIVVLLYTANMKETSGTATTETELPVPVLFLPTNQVIMPVNNCIVVTNVGPPKHGVRTQYTDSLFCLDRN